MEKETCLTCQWPCAEINIHGVTAKCGCEWSVRYSDKIHADDDCVCYERMGDGNSFMFADAK